MADRLPQGYRWQYSFTGEPVLVDENGTPVERSQTFSGGWGGRGNDMLPDGSRVPGTDGASLDAKRYREMAGQRQDAPVIDQMHADEARGYGTDAIMELAKTAAGTTPSQAVLLGRQGTQSAINAQTSMANSVRGGAGARAAAGRAAQMNQASIGSTGRLQEQATRAGEMAGARGALMDATTKQRGQDIAVATDQAKLEAQQRAANNQREQYYERLGWETKNAQLGYDLGRTAAEQGAANANAAQGLKEDQASWDRGKDAVGAGTGAVQGGIAAYQAANNTSDPKDPNKTGSDERMKKDISPLTKMLTAPGYAADGSGSATLPMMDPGGGLLLQQSAEGRGYYGSMDSDDPMRPSLGSRSKPEKEAPAPTPKAKATPASKPKTRKLTDKEMMDWASAEMARFQRQTAALPGTPTAVQPALDRDVALSDEKTKKKSPKPAGLNLTEAEQDEEEMRRFFGGDAGVVKFDKPTDEDHAKAAYENREGARAQQRGRDEAAERNRKAFEEAKKSAEAEEIAREGSFKAWVNRTARRLVSTSPEERAKNEREFEEKLAAARQQADDFARPKLPEGMPEWLARQPVSPGYRREHDSRYFREPVSFERDTTSSDEKTKKVGDSSPMASANRSMDASSYEYRPQFLPDEQRLGEVNIGPMANKMAKDPIAKTAIVEDPNTGLLAIDKTKGLKLALGGLASLQREVDQLKQKRARA